jgi:L-rhamnose mutarotase
MRGAGRGKKNNGAMGRQYSQRDHLMRRIQRKVWMGVCATVCCAAIAGCAQPKVQRVGWVIEIKKESIPEYVKLHANPWPEVVKAHKAAHIRNYSIYLIELAPDRHYLFGYLEYTGNDWQADLAGMKANRALQDWLKITDPTQIPCPTRKPGEWWMRGEEIFRID